MKDGAVLTAGAVCTAADWRLVADFEELCREQPKLARPGTLLACRQLPQAGPPDNEVCLPGSPG